LFFTSEQNLLHEEPAAFGAEQQARTGSHVAAPPGERRVGKDTFIRHFSKSIRWLPFYHTVNVKPWEIDRLHTIYHTYEFDDVLAEYQTKMQDWELSQSCSENPR